MKVCTDSCILGAWSARHIWDSNRILDIGTGTSLLALMMAQKSPAQIDAIEWDLDSSIQAEENIQLSPWPERIRVTCADARSFCFPEPFDFIVSNPPFYESDLQSQDQKKNKAKHEESLTLEELLGVISNNLLPTGAFSVLIPFHRTDYFENLALAKGFFCQQKLFVRQTPDHPPFRSICLFSSKKSFQAQTGNLTIKNGEGQYSLEFTELMGDYYG